MKKLILTAAAVAAIILPSIASAQSAAPDVCRAAKAGETSNATMGSTQLVCRPVDMAKVMAAEKTLMSMMSTKMAAGQMKKMHAAQATMSNELMLPIIPGTNGNPSDN
jgi:outer membrane lipoprotein SlyB